METKVAPRERILTTAARLFYQQGVHATGIDQIIAEAVVAKATLYYHFPSKNNLVRAYLRRRHDDWMREFAGRLAKVRRCGLAALADALGQWFDSGDFNGCAFINVTTDSANDEWRQFSCAHKLALKAIIEGLVKTTVAQSDRGRIADQALLVVEGMIVRFQMTRDLSLVEDGRAVLKMIESQRTTASSRAVRSRRR